MTLRLFSLNYDLSERPIPWLLEIVRWTAPLTVVGGVFRIAHTFLSDERERFRARRKAGHTIICGLGGRGAWVCELMSANSEQAMPVGLEIDIEGDAVGELRRKGVPVLHGSGREFEMFKMAGIEKALQVVLVAGKDQTNLAILQEMLSEIAAMRLHTPPKIIAAVERHETRSLLREPLAARGATLIGFREQASLLLARDAGLRIARTGRTLHAAPIILIEAHDDFREDLIRAFARILQISAERKPVIHICGATPDDQPRFEDAFPATPLCAEIHWHTDSAERLMPPDSPAPDLAVFALRPDSLSISTATRFKLRRPSMDGECVIACVQDTGDLLDLFSESMGGHGSIQIRSLYQNSVQERGFIGPAEEQAGRKIHEDYNRKEAEKNPQRLGNLVRWEDLSEFKKNDNRLAALHNELKRAVCMTLKQNEIPQEEIQEFIAISEHMRWLGCHIMEGWRFQEKDGTREDWRTYREIHRIHESLCSYESLAAGSKEYLREVAHRILNPEIQPGSTARG
jgi:hypothetical protein